ncbi:MAG: ComF family protein [Thermoanaerobacteraceae bacterium]|uniref:ComF family protein n=1 Tax=Thermanaeromonas sp. C210 TaxID=2731925 RepID=UPI00155BC8AE|nr:ComF family protein [Thermanaeromonas sp. C210]MBE3581802.1 ComF family protein [Thermoanaerobacteraceae bacterium]GFN22755.1 phosphoribosyltransferase [Thermanaeromonas sp. C210]
MGWKDWLFVRDKECFICRRPGALGYLCPSCSRTLKTWEQEFRPCRRCGRLLCKEYAGELCPQCGEKLPPFRLARAVGPYRGELRRAILEFKYRGRRSLALPLGYLLSRVVAEEPLYGRPRAVIPVPLSSQRLKERAFNQSALLARELSRLLGIKLLEEVLVKVRHTPPQAGLDRLARLQNLQRSFEVVESSRIVGLDVLLVDDVLTTGITAAACTVALLEGGARSVAVVTVATSLF